MNGYWPYFRRNYRYNRGCSGNCNQMPVHSTPENESRNMEQAVQNNTISGNDMCVENKHDLNNFFMKSSCLGSVIIPAHTEIGSVYHIASVNMQTSCFDRFHIKLCFSCNLLTTSAKINLNFRMFKRGNTLIGQIPVSCNYDFCRDEESNESNALSFTACDYDSFQYEYCNYSVYATVTGITTSGTTSVANPILSASLVEIP